MGDMFNADTYGETHLFAPELSREAETRLDRLRHHDNMLTKALRVMTELLAEDKRFGSNRHDFLLDQSVDDVDAVIDSLTADLATNHKLQDEIHEWDVERARVFA